MLTQLAIYLDNTGVEKTPSEKPFQHIIQIISKKVVINILEPKQTNKS